MNPDASMDADPEIDITKIGHEDHLPPNGPSSPYNDDIYDEEQSVGSSNVCVLLYEPLSIREDTQN